MATKRRYKARKTPSSDYPSVPPGIPSPIETIYYSTDSSVLDSAVAPFRDQVVTSHILYKPALLGTARLTFQGTRWEIHHERDFIGVVPFPTHSQMADWETNLVKQWNNLNTRSSQEGVSFYVYDDSFDFSEQRFEMLQEEFLKFLISQQILELYHNPYLKIYRKFDEPEESFFERCLEKTRENFAAEMKTPEETILRREEQLKERLDREVRQLGSDPADLSPSAADETAAPTSTAIPISREEIQQDMGVQESIFTIEDLRKQISKLEIEREIKVKEFEEKLHKLAGEREKDILRLNRSNVQVLRFSLVWLPYTQFIIQEAEGRRLELVQSF